MLKVTNNILLVLFLKIIPHVQPASQTTPTMTDTGFTLGPASRAIQYKNFSNGFEVFAVGDISNADGTAAGSLRLSMADLSGALELQLDPSIEQGSVDSLALVDPCLVATFSRSATQVSWYKVYMSGSTLSVAIASTVTFQYSYEGGIDVPNTNYCVVGPTPGNPAMAKVDYNMASTEAIFKEDYTAFTDLGVCLQTFAGDYYMLAIPKVSVLIIQSSDLGINIKITDGGNAFTPVSILENNLVLKNIFTIQLNLVTNELSLHYIFCNGYSSGVPDACLPSVVLESGAPTSSMVNLGSYQYLAVVRASLKTISIVSKTDLTFMDWTPTIDKPLEYSLVGGAFFDSRTFVLGLLGYNDTSKCYQFQRIVVAFDACLYRSPSTMICQTCEAGLILSDLDPNNKCMDPSTLPQGFGLDNSQMLMVACQSAGCLDCFADFTACSSCDSANGFFLDPSTSTCLAFAAIPAGYGVDTSANTITTCLSGASCANCRADYSVCAACNVGLGYFGYTGTCTAAAALPAGTGGNLVSGQAVPCQNSGCQTCNADYSVCDPCGSGSAARQYKQQDGSCVSRGSIPTGFSANEGLGTVIQCSVSKCLDCFADAAICLKCDTLAGHYLQAGACLPLASAPVGFGIDLGSSGLKACTGTGCLACSANYLVCTICDTGFLLVDSACTQNSSQLTNTSTLVTEGQKVPIHLSKLSSSKTSEDFRIFLTVADSAKLEDIGAFYRSLSDLLELSFEWRDSSSGVGEVVTLAAQKTPSLTGVAISMRINSVLKFEDYLVDVSPRLSVIRMEQPGKDDLLINIGNLTFKYENLVSSGSLKAVESMTSTTTALLTPTSVNSVGASTGLALLVSLDVSGTLMKLVQTMKIMNRLYFINVNFGRLLDSTLQSFALGSIRSKDSPRSYRHVSNTLIYRGKLSQTGLPFFVLEEFPYQCWLYLASWVLTQASRLTTGLELKLNRWLLLLTFYLPKVHLIVFNLLFVDFVWILPRAAFHCAGNSAGVRALNSFLQIAIALDLYWLLSVVYSCPSQLMIDQLVPPSKKTEASPAQTVQNSPKTPLNHHFGSQAEKEESMMIKSPKLGISGHEPRKKAINYRRTYQNIRNNNSLLLFAFSNFRMFRAVLESSLCRLTVFAQNLRLLVYHLCIVSLQYSSGLLLFALLSSEVATISLVVYCWLKNHHLKRRFHLVSQLIQCLLLVSFVCIAFSLVGNSFADPVSGGKQLAGVVLVICFCLSEYLVLAVDIGFALVAFWQERKKKGLAKPVAEKKEFFGIFWFIKSDDIVPTKPDQEMLPESSKLAANPNSVSHFHRNIRVITVKMPKRVQNPYKLLGLQQSRSRISINGKITSKVRRSGFQPGANIITVADNRFSTGPLVSHLDY